MDLSIHFPRRPPVTPAIVVLVVVGYLVWDYYSGLAPGQTALYVRGAKCAECHAEQAHHWTGSDHDLAMDLATERTVLGNFDDQTFEHFGVTSRMFRKDGKYYIETEGPDGEMAEFPIKYTFGVRPLQQYMVEFPDGRVQVLTIAWDTVHNKWFDLHPHERIEHDDWLHWTKAGQNWNFMCAECHSTDLRKNFDLANDSYKTMYSEIDVSCEACHGPGSTHVELAEAWSPFWDRNYGFGLANLKSADSKTEIETCARCHSRRRMVHPGFDAGDRFLDFYEPELLDGQLYYPDGQILDEDYEYGSFLQSRMHRENVRCTDCHDPHTTRVRLEGNALCLRCHTLQKGNFDAPAHHHHQVDGAGSKCVACHMPTKTYMGVDPRRDHSLRVPRPDLTVKLGVPNACNQCHTKENETPQWAADKIVEWFGPERKQDPHFAESLAAGRAARPEALNELIALARPLDRPDKAKDVGDFVRASAMSLLANYPLDSTQDAVLAGLKDESALVRTAAIRNLGLQRELSDRDAQQLLELVGPMLDDPVRLVRTEAVQVLTRVPRKMFSGLIRPKFDRVMSEWREGLQGTADDAGTHLALGGAQHNMGAITPAREEYMTAMRLHPSPIQAVQARIQLAMLEHTNGNNLVAEVLYRETIDLADHTLDTLIKSHETAPEDEKSRLAHAIDFQRTLLADVHYSLGLLMAEENSRWDEAAEELGAAAAITPENSRLQYNYGLVLQRLGRREEAEAALLHATALMPRETEYLHALALVYIEQRKWREALEIAQRLVEIDSRYRGLLQQVLSQSTTPLRHGPSMPQLVPR